MNMVKVFITKNTKIEFYSDAAGRHKQWYGSDIFKNQILEFDEVHHATNTYVWFVGMDGEVCGLPLDSFSFVSYTPNK